MPSKLSIRKSEEHMLDYVMITNTKLCSQEGRGKCFSRNSEVIFMEKQ